MGYDRITLSAFRARVKSGEAASGVIVTAQAGAKALVRKAKDGGADGETTIPWVISTARVDRSTDTLAVDGWELDSFVRAGGPILYGHESVLYFPVARPKDGSTKIAGKRLVSTAIFPSRDLYELGHTVGQLALHQYLTNASVGFLPIDYAESDREHPSGWYNGIDFKRQELLEWSIVAVPDNPDALQEARAKHGIELRSVHAFYDRLLSGELSGDEIDEIVRRSVERAWQITKSIQRTHVHGKAISMAKGAISYDSAHEGGTDMDREGPWDAASEVATAEGADQLLRMHAWVDDEGDPETKDSYKLPHHRADGTLVWAGVVAAGAALVGARGGVDISGEDIAGVADHLARHYEDFGEEVPEGLAALKSSDDGDDDSEAKDLEGDEEIKEADSDDDVDAVDAVDADDDDDDLSRMEAMIAAMQATLEEVKGLMMRNEAAIAQLVSFVEERGASDEDIADDDGAEKSLLDFDPRSYDLDSVVKAAVQRAVSRSNQ